MYPLGIMLSRDIKSILPYLNGTSYEKLYIVLQFLRGFRSDQELPFPYYYSEFINGAVHYCTVRDMETMDKSSFYQINSFSTSSGYTGSRRRYIGKFGKWFKTVADWCNIEISAIELSEIVVGFAALNTPISFEVVSGKDIKKWYLEDNTVVSGDLRNSCMRYPRCQDYLDIYVDHCKMVIAKQGNESKIVGRTLIWQDQYHDRVYAINTHVATAIKKYLADSKFVPIWLHTVEMSMELSDYEYYPYMDNMNRYCEFRKILTNDQDAEATHEFNDTGGEYHGIDNDDDDYNDDGD